MRFYNSVRYIYYRFPRCNTILVIRNDKSGPIRFARHCLNDFFIFVLSNRKDDISLSALLVLSCGIISISIRPVLDVQKDAKLGEFESIELSAASAGIQSATNSASDKTI